MDEAIVATGGHLRLETGATGNDITVNAAVTSATGSLGVLSSGEVLQNAELVGGTLLGGGSIEVRALGGGIVMSEEARSQTNGGTIRYQASEEVVLGQLDTRTAADQGGTLTEQSSWGSISVEAQSGSITDAASSGDTGVDLYGNGVKLQATAGVGELGGGVNAVETEAVLTSAHTGSGDLHLVDQSDVEIGSLGSFEVVRVGTDGSTSTEQIGAQSGYVAPIGSVVQESVGGDITLSVPLTLLIGNVRLNAQGVNADVVLSGQLSASVISVLAGGDVVQQANIVGGSSGAGTVEVEAVGGSVLMDSAVSIQTQGKNIQVRAGTGATLGVLDARTAAGRSGGGKSDQANWGDLFVVAGSGSILDAGSLDTGVDIWAKQARLEAGNGVGALGVGTTDALETEVDLLASSVGAGGLSLEDQSDLKIGLAGDVSIQQVGADGGLITSSAVADLEGLSSSGGTLVARSMNGTLRVNEEVSVTGAGNILLEARSGSGALAQVRVNEQIESTGGNITVLGVNQVVQQANILVGGTGSIDVESTNETITMDNDILSRTNGGNIRYLGGGGVRVGQLDARTAADRAGETLDDIANWGMYRSELRTGRSST